jgi:hypothetical protein
MRLPAILAALGLAAAAGACGSDDTKKNDRDPVAEFQRRAGEICTDVNERIVGMEARIQEKTRTERDRGAVARLDNELYRRYAVFVQELVRRLDELRGSAPDKAAFRTYLSSLRKLGRLSRSTYKAAAAGRDDASFAHFQKLNPQVEKAEDEADRLKLAPCAELSSPTLTGSG